MVAWHELGRQHPELATLVEEVFAARRMKVLATIRFDGRPRLSEVSGVFVREGELWLGIIPSAKDRDLERDPRCSVHCGSPGDEFAASARASGLARAPDPDEIAALGLAGGAAPETFSLYRIDVDEVVVTRPEPATGHILIEWWSAATGVGRLVRPGG